MDDAAEVPVSPVVMGYPVGTDDDGNAEGYAEGKEVGRPEVGTDDEGVSV